MDRRPVGTRSLVDARSERVGARGNEAFDRRTPRRLRRNRLIKHTLVLVTAVVLVGSGCSGATSRASAGKGCDELADAHITARQEYFDHVADMSIEEYEELTSRSDGAPPEFLAFDQQTELLEARGEQLGCSINEVKALIHERIDRLRAKGPVGEFLIRMYDY